MHEVPKMKFSNQWNSNLSLSVRLFQTCFVQEFHSCNVWWIHLVYPDGHSSRTPAGESLAVRFHRCRGGRQQGPTVLQGYPDRFCLTLSHLLSSAQGLEIDWTGFSQSRICWSISNWILSKATKCALVSLFAMAWWFCQILACYGATVSSFKRDENN